MKPIRSVFRSVLSVSVHSATTKDALPNGQPNASRRSGNWEMIPDHPLLSLRDSQMQGIGQTPKPSAYGQSGRLTNPSRRGVPNYEQICRIPGNEKSSLDGMSRLELVGTMERRQQRTRFGERKARTNATAPALNTIRAFVKAEPNNSQEPYCLLL